MHISLPPLLSGDDYTMAEFASCNLWLAAGPYYTKQFSFLPSRTEISMIPEEQHLFVSEDISGL